MTGDERLDRQERIDLPPMIPSSVAVVGCGGIGTFIGQACLLAGVKEVMVFDSDILEKTNLNRLPYPEKWVGMRKTECLKRYLLEIVGALDERQVIQFDNVEDEADLWPLDGAEFVFITADRGAARNLVADYCKKKGIPHVQAGYDGNHISLFMRSFDAEDLPVEQGYTIVPSWGAPTMMIASYAMYMMAYPVMLRKPFSISVLNQMGYMERHKCEVCGFESKNPWDMELHVKICSVCRQEFHKKEDYDAHIKFRCPDCGRPSCEERVMRGHQNKKCKHCDFRTCIPDKLTAHMEEKHPAKSKEKDKDKEKEPKEE